MKKYIAFLLFVSMLFSFTACGNEGKKQNPLVQTYKVTEYIEKGNTDSAKKALEEGVTNTGDEELEKMLAELEVTSDDSSESQSASNEEVSLIEDDISNVQEHNIKKVWSSSYLDETNKAGIKHLPDRVFDGKLDSAWVEGVNGTGVGEYLTIELDKKCYISGIDIWAGYHKTEKLYKNNARPYMVEIDSSDGIICNSKLDDIMQKQTISFDKEVITDSITIKILSVYPGEVFEDTVITEVELF